MLNLIPALDLAYFRDRTHPELLEQPAATTRYNSVMGENITILMAQDKHGNRYDNLVFPIQAFFYRNEELYAMGPGLEVNLDAYSRALASLAAILKDEEKTGKQYNVSTVTG